VQPSISTSRGSYATSRVSSGAAAWIAFSPSQLRALWARRPGTGHATRIVPWQPASTAPLVGSISTDRSACSSSRRVSTSRLRPLLSASTSSLSYSTKVRSYAGSGSVAARCSSTASPLFMSLVPQP
jgi:hypothetical protein